MELLYFAGLVVILGLAVAAGAQPSHPPAWKRAAERLGATFLGPYELALGRDAVLRWDARDRVFLRATAPSRLRALPAFQVFPETERRSSVCDVAWPGLRCVTEAPDEVAAFLDGSLRATLRRLPPSWELEHRHGLLSLRWDLRALRFPSAAHHVMEPGGEAIRALAAAGERTVDEVLSLGCVPRGEDFAWHREGGSVEVRTVWWEGGPALDLRVARNGGARFDVRWDGGVASGVIPRDLTDAPVSNGWLRGRPATLALTLRVDADATPGAADWLLRLARRLGADDAPYR